MHFKVIQLTDKALHMTLGYYLTMLSILLPPSMSNQVKFMNIQQGEKCVHMCTCDPNPSTDNPIMGDCLHNARKASKDLGQVYNNYAFLSNNFHNPKYT
jgi:hypothetical protein